jgi:type I restriction enzyme, R subunit
MSCDYSEDGLVETATQQGLEALGWSVVTAWEKESLATQADRSDGLLGPAE